jgi:hypothetical protein
MNNPASTLEKTDGHSAAETKPGTPLLDKITDIKASTGDGLNDFELTRLLEKSELPKDAGFEFLSYAERVLTLSVPKQDCKKWYPEKGWITPEKEKKAKEIAEKYELAVCEPPDSHYTMPGKKEAHHHLEMCNDRETIVVIHPLYLKLRLFLTTNSTRSGQAAQRPLSLGPDLLKDLASLYDQDKDQNENKEQKSEDQKASP